MIRKSTCKGESYKKHKEAITHFFDNYYSHIEERKARGVWNCEKTNDETGEYMHRHNAHEYEPLPRYRVFTYDAQTRGEKGNWNPFVGQTIRKKGFIIKALAKMEGTLMDGSFKRTNLLLYLEAIDPDSKTPDRWKWKLNDNELKYFN